MRLSARAASSVARVSSSASTVSDSVRGVASSRSSVSPSRQPDDHGVCKLHARPRSGHHPCSSFQVCDENFVSNGAARRRRAIIAADRESASSGRPGWPAAGRGRALKCAQHLGGPRRFDNERRMASSGRAVRQAAPRRGNLLAEFFSTFALSIRAAVIEA